MTIGSGAGSWQAVSIYIVIMAVISFLSVFGLKELTRADISGTEAHTIIEVALVAQD